MHTLNPRKVGMVTGVFFGGLHFVWSLVILVGWAQPLLNFFLMLHMLQPLLVVDSYSVSMMLALVLVTTILGYFIGYLYAIIWNRLYK